MAPCQSKATVELWQAIILARDVVDAFFSKRRYFSGKWKFPMVCPKDRSWYLKMKVAALFPLFEMWRNIFINIQTFFTNNSSKSVSQPSFTPQLHCWQYCAPVCTVHVHEVYIRVRGTFMTTHCPWPPALCPEVWQKEELFDSSINNKTTSAPSVYPPCKRSCMVF